MKVFITGGAGFIGSQISDYLIQKGFFVTVYDNFSTGSKKFLRKHNNLRIISADVLDSTKLKKAIKGHDIVYHFSANADVRKGAEKTDLDLEQEIIATYNVLDAMRIQNVNKIVFPSSMTVYGKPNFASVDESYGPCLPSSLYASGKLANEGMISAYCESFNLQAWIFRFANVVGPRLTHGVIYDLINKLKKNNNRLEILGDGNQTKPYIYIDDIINSIDFVLKNSSEKVNLINVGVEDEISVKKIVSLILKKMNLINVELLFGKTPYGWKGDVTKFSLNINKLKTLGYTPQFNSKQAVEKTIEYRLKELG